MWKNREQKLFRKNEVSMPTVTGKRHYLWQCSLMVIQIIFFKDRSLFKLFLLKTELFSSPSKVFKNEKKKKSQKNVYMLRLEGNSSPAGFYSLALRAGLQTPCEIPY